MYVPPARWDKINVRMDKKTTSAFNTLLWCIADKNKYRSRNPQPIRIFRKLKDMQFFFSWYCWETSKRLKSPETPSIAGLWERGRWNVGILTHSLKHSASAIWHRPFVRPWYYSGRAGSCMSKRGSPTVGVEFTNF